MALDVVDINLDPNQRWFVRLEDSGTDILVEIYNTLADAQAQTARVGFGSASFGSATFALLTADTTEPAFGGEIALFNAELPWHFLVDGALLDATKIFAIGPFTDLPTIEDALMVTEQMIQDRAAVEINLGTHTAVRRVLQIKEHTPTLDEGDIVTYDSSRRSISAVKQQIEAVTLIIRQNEDTSLDFSDELEIVEWQDFSRA